MTDKKDPIQAQLNRISGQVEGIARMYQDERACIDVVRQVVAVRSSLGRVARDLLSSEARKCSRDDKDSLDDVLKEVFRY
jgi:CsoR family transcriptional regulator, copper-sensing transcriptional repressor